MLKILRMYEVWVFLALIVVVNTLFVLGIERGFLPNRLYSTGRFLLLGATLIFIILISRGLNGVRELLMPLLKWRIPLYWYALALSWVAVIAAITLIGKGIVTGNGFAELKLDFGLAGNKRLMFNIFIGALIGEIVWVGYAVGKLSSRMTPYSASLVVGFFWTLWWMPMVVFNMGVIPDLPFFPLLANMMGAAIICGFVYMHTGSSLCVFILQLLLNLNLLFFPLSPGVAGIPAYTAFSVLYFVAGTLMYVVFGPKPLFGFKSVGLNGGENPS